MRIPNAAHLAQPWRIHAVVRDFRLEDVSKQPEISGTADDFERVISMMTNSDPAHASNLPARLLWQARDRLGQWLGLGAITEPVDDAVRLPIPATAETTLGERLPSDLVGTADGVRFQHLPFMPLYRTDDEFAAEISNRTVHGVMHLAWVAQGQGHFQAQMAVYVKPRGTFGRAYMAFIKPFRYLIVYPALERELARAWQGRAGAVR